MTYSCNPFTSVFGALSMFYTTQAKDDAYTIVEGTGSLFLFDVMANDSGYGKTLHALTDGTERDIDLQEFFDLATRDANGTIVGGALMGFSDYSTLGAKVAIVNGKIAYSLAGTPLAAAVDALAAGETLTDTVTYTIRLANGLLSAATMTVTLAGINDGPTVSLADLAGAVTEDATSPALTDSGTITFDDADLPDSHTVSVTADGGNTLGGTLTALVSDAATGAGGGTVTWTYTLDNAATQALAEGETATESFTVTIDDGHGGTVSRTVAVTVTGTNDAPEVVALTGSVGEDGPSFSQDLLSGATDTDNGAVLTITGLPASLTTADGRVLTLGTHYTLTGSTFELTAAGFALFNDLAAGDTDTLTVTFSVSDGIASVANTLTLTIDGAADGASLPAVYAGADPNDFDAAVGLPAAGFTVINGAGVIDGDDAQNIVNGSAGMDTISALGANDRVYAAGGNDTISGGNQNDLLYGQAGDDTISGDAGLDLVYGGSGNDTITGGTENDTIYGGSGNDTIDGGGGDDNIIGGYGADTINVATGQDTITYRSNLDTGDTINGFGGAGVAGGDLINLAQMDANTANGAPNEAFLWGGQQTGAVVQAFSVTWYQDGGGVRILADTDGNLATAEFTIFLSGVTTVWANDFNL